LTKTIRLEIVSPQKIVYAKDVNMLIVQSTAGSLGFLPNHAPLVAALKPAPMRLLTDDGEELIAVSGGFVEVQPTEITVLAANAERPQEIDVNRAQKAYERAKVRLEKREGIDVARAQAALERAKARLKTTGKQI